jgi:protein TonB
MMNKLTLTIIFLLAVITGCSSATSMIYYGHEVTIPATPIERSKPDYPISAARKYISGFIIAELVIAEDGEVEEMKVVESVPTGVFDAKGKRAIKKWKYKPAQINGKPVKQKVTVRLDWNI